jgi:hypothetical protein
MKIHYEEFLRALPMLFAALFIAILFIQSGLDKVFDFGGNLGWLKGHFEKTPVRSLVPVMLGVLTVMELATGVLAAVSIIYFLVTGSQTLIFWSAVAGAATITALFFGQRMAKDYPGAAVLVPYFIVHLVLMYLSKP